MKFFITGTPGTGKSTLSVVLSKALQKDLGSCDIYEIKELLIKYDLLEEYEPERDTTVFDDVLATQTIQNFLKEKDNYILAGPCLPLNELDFSCIIVLTCSLKAVLEGRLSQRGYRESKIQENLEAELVGEILGEVMDYFTDNKNILILDSCKNTPDQLINNIKQFLNLL